MTQQDNPNSTSSFLVQSTIDECCASLKSDPRHWTEFPGAERARTDGFYLNVDC